MEAAARGDGLLDRVHPERDRQGRHGCLGHHLAGTALERTSLGLREAWAPEDQDVWGLTTCILEENGP